MDGIGDAWRRASETRRIMKTSLVALCQIHENCKRLVSRKDNEVGDLFWDESHLFYVKDW